MVIPSRLQSTALVTVDVSVAAQGTLGRLFSSFDRIGHMKYFALVCVVATIVVIGCQSSSEEKQGKSTTPVPSTAPGTKTTSPQTGPSTNLAPQ